MVVWVSPCCASIFMSAARWQPSPQEYAAEKHSNFIPTLKASVVVLAKLFLEGLTTDNL